MKEQRTINWITSGIPAKSSYLTRKSSNIALDEAISLLIKKGCSLFRKRYNSFSRASSLTSSILVTNLHDSIKSQFSVTLKGDHYNGLSTISNLYRSHKLISRFTLDTFYHFPVCLFSWVNGENCLKHVTSHAAKRYDFVIIRF